MDAVRVCVFAKPPLPGEVKTRLAADIGAERAAELAAAFLRDTLEQLRGLEWVAPAVATTGDIAPFIDDGRLPVWLQGQGDLGQRIERIMRRALREHPRAIAIGADTPGLPACLLERGRDALAAGRDAVLGPAEDGGFYLMGLGRCPTGLLHDLPWSASETLARTLARLRHCGLSVEVIEPWFDVDRRQDLARLSGLLREGVLQAPWTRRALLGAGIGGPGDAVN